MEKKTENISAPKNVYQDEVLFMEEQTFIRHVIVFLGQAWPVVSSLVILVCPLSKATAVHK